MSVLIAFLVWLHTIAGPAPVASIICDPQGCQIDIQASPSSEPIEYFIRAA